MVVLFSLVQITTYY